MYKLIILVLLVGIASFAAAQTFDENTQPIKDTNESSDYHCNEYRLKMLYAATQVGDPNQEGYLLAAQAYNELNLAGQKC